MLHKIKILLVVLLFFQYGTAQEVIALYPGTAPGTLIVADTETFSKSTKGNGRSFVTNVTRPTITVFWPKKMSTSRTAVIICPGGGYSRLSIEDGGYEAAKVLADAGITAIVLKYRTLVNAAYTDYKTAPLQDLEQAVNLVYANAAKWNIDTAKLGLLGFSAGGHLTAMAATSFVKRKPAFTLLAYPVISFMDSLTSNTSNSRNNLLGNNIGLEDKISWSPELHITQKTPPSFLVHAKDDATSLVANSIVYYYGLKAKKVAAELLLYEKGGHGFALYNKEEDKYWMPDALKWLALNGFYTQ